MGGQSIERTKWKSGEQPPLPEDSVATRTYEVVDPDKSRISWIAFCALQDGSTAIRVSRRINGKFQWVDVVSAGPFAFIVFDDTVTNKELTHLEEKRLLGILNDDRATNR